MIDSISPYSLLKRSKPKPPNVYVTDYDLYSAAQHAPHEDAPMDPHPVFIPETAAQPQAMQKKTHYIAGIQQRHSRASSRTQMNGTSLPVHSPSLHIPST